MVRHVQHSLHRPRPTIPQDLTIRPAAEQVPFPWWSTGLGRNSESGLSVPWIVACTACALCRLRDYPAKARVSDDFRCGQTSVAARKTVKASVSKYVLLEEIAGRFIDAYPNTPKDDAATVAAVARKLFTK